MAKLYVIRNEDFFKAYAEGMIPEDSIRGWGSIWIELSLTDEQCLAYSYPISKA